MRSSLMLMVLVAAILAAPVVSVAAPPAKPLPVTAKQFEQLRQIEAQPEHAAILKVQAAQQHFTLEPQFLELKGLCQQCSQAES